MSGHNPFEAFINSLPELDEYDEYQTGTEHDIVWQDDASHLLVQIVDPVDPIRIEHHIKQYPSRFTKSQIKRACLNHPDLTVVFNQGILLVGTPDKSGGIIMPDFMLTPVKVEQFMKENFGQWVVVPAKGYGVGWEVRCDEDEGVDAIAMYPVLDKIKHSLTVRPNLQLFRLHQLMLEALGLPTKKTLPYIEM